MCNEARNVVGLMPHPERASDPLTGSVDGAELLSSLLTSALSGARAEVGLNRRAYRRVRGIFACWRTAALTPTVRQAE